MIRANKPGIPYHLQKERINMKKSENPYKYGDELIGKISKLKYMIIAVCGDMVVYTGSGWYYWREIEKAFNIIQPYTWVDITKDNWKEYRDEIVWAKYGVERRLFSFRLIYFNENNGEASVMDRNGTVFSFKSVSLYNEAGERATWEGEE